MCCNMVVSLDAKLQQQEKAYAHLSPTNPADYAILCKIATHRQTMIRLACEEIRNKFRWLQALHSRSNPNCPFLDKIADMCEGIIGWIKTVIGLTPPILRSGVSVQSVDV